MTTKTQAKPQIIRGKNQIAKIVETLRGDLTIQGTGRKLLTLGTASEKVAKIGEAKKIRLERNVNQHIALYSFVERNRTVEFKAARIK